MPAVDVIAMLFGPDLIHKAQEIQRNATRYRFTFKYGETAKSAKLLLEAHAADFPAGTQINMALTPNPLRTSEDLWDVSLTMMRRHGVQGSGFLRACEQGLTGLYEQGHAVTSHNFWQRQFLSPTAREALKCTEAPTVKKRRTVGKPDPMTEQLRGVLGPDLWDVELSADPSKAQPIEHLLVLTFKNRGSARHAHGILRQAMESETDLPHPICSFEFKPENSHGTKSRQRKFHTLCITLESAEDAQSMLQILRKMVFIPFPFREMAQMPLTPEGYQALRVNAARTFLDRINTEPHKSVCYELN